VRTSGSGAHESAATLRDYLQILRRRKWLVVQTLVLVPLAAVAFSLQQKPVYEASADVLLSRQNLANTLNGLQDPTASVQADRVAQTQADIARSPAVARRVIAQLHLTDRTAGDLLANSSVTAKQGADILGFTVRDRDAALAARLADAYATQYRLYRHALDTDALQAARVEVEQRIADLGTSRGALYESLVEKEQQLRTMEALQTSNSTVINRPSSASQVSPRPFRNAVLGLVLGLFIGVGFAFLRETLDTRVRSAQEIGDRLGLPLLARIPEPAKRLRADDRLVMLADPAGVDAEAFRMLRTNIEFATLGHDVKTVVVTSAVEKEGKSTTIANLAVALARGGQKVILVDLDLRRPFLDKFFDLQGRPGITQVALGRASLNDAIVRVPIVPIEPNASLRPRYDLSGNEDNGSGRLAILGTGPIPPDPGEFVGSHRLAEVLEELRGLADVVLVDAPPVLHVNDAMVLSSRVDGLLLVSRMETLRRPMLTELHRLLESTPAHKVGYVVTGAESDEAYGYGYAYGYSYAPRPYEPEPAEA
jgi:polysaccharide biosynthesis transport protein